MGKKFIYMVVFASLWGCAPSVGVIGYYKLVDDLPRQAVQIATGSQDVIRDYVCPPGKQCEVTGTWNASSLTAEILRGTGPAALLAGGYVGGQAVRRPSSTRIVGDTTSSSFNCEGDCSSDIEITQNNDD